MKKQGIRVKGKIADLMDRSQVKSLIQDIIAVYGKIDVLVNNAGMIQTGVAGEEEADIEDATG